MQEGRSLLTISAGRNGRSSIDSFLWVPLKANRLVLLLRLPWSLSSFCNCQVERHAVHPVSEGPEWTAQELLGVALRQGWYLRTGRVLITMGLHHRPAFIMSIMNSNEAQRWSRQWVGHSSRLGREEVQEVNRGGRTYRIAGGRKDPGMERHSQR